MAARRQREGVDRRSGHDLSVEGIVPLARTVSVQEQVYGRLRSAIIGGAIPAGSALLTTQLASQLEVSRTPVREAVQRLVQDGLLERMDTGVVRVRRVTRQEVTDIMAIRAELDAYAAREFVRRGPDPAMMREVEAVAAEMRSLGTDPSATSAQLALNDGFHRLIRQGSGNTMLADLLHEAGSLTLRNLVVVLQHRTSIEKNNTEHEEIVAALAEGDPGRAADAARRHVASAARELMAKYDEMDVAQDGGGTAGDALRAGRR